MLLQLERAFTSAWDAAASDMTNPGATPDDLELAEIEGTVAWRQLQDSTGVASGSSQAVTEATQFALSRGVRACVRVCLCLCVFDTALQHVNQLCAAWFDCGDAPKPSWVRCLDSTGIFVLLNAVVVNCRCLLSTGLAALSQQIFPL